MPSVIQLLVGLEGYSEGVETEVWHSVWWREENERDLLGVAGSSG